MTAGFFGRSPVCGTQEVPKAGTVAEKGLAIADKISYNIILSELYNFDISMDGFPSGQRGQTVNLLQIASVVRIHLRPICRRGGTGETPGT